MDNVMDVQQRLVSRSVDQEASVFGLASPALNFGRIKQLSSNDQGIASVEIRIPLMPLPPFSTCRCSAEPIRTPFGGHS